MSERIDDKICIDLSSLVEQEKTNKEEAIKKANEMFGKGEINQEQHKYILGLGTASEINSYIGGRAGLNQSLKIFLDDGLITKEKADELRNIINYIEASIELGNILRAKK